MIDRDPGDEDDAEAIIAMTAAWLMAEIARQLKPYRFSAVASTEPALVIYFRLEPPIEMITFDFMIGRDIHAHDPGDEHRPDPRLVLEFA